MTDPLVLVLAALASVTTGLTFLFRLLMAEKDKSFAQLKQDSDQRYEDIRKDRDWIRDQLIELQHNQVATLKLVSDSITVQGQSLAVQGVGVKRIAELLEATINPNDPRNWPGRS